MVDNFLQDAKVLVVGGAGFIGNNLCRRIIDHKVKDLIIVDNLLSSDRVNIADDHSVTFIEGSITSDDILNQLPGDLDFVFHLACYHGNQSSIADPLADHENGALSSLKLFNHLSIFSRLKKVVYAGAGCAVAKKTFDDVEATTEDASVSLSHDSPYSISKLIGEMYANYYFKQNGLPISTARFQNVYGPGEILGAGRWRGTPHTVWRNVTPSFIWRALHKQALPLENGGLASRDFIYVDDLVAGLIACAERGEPGEVYNLASGEETSIATLAEIINEIADNPTPVEMSAPRDWDGSGRRYGATTKSREALNFETSVSVVEGIGKTVAWTIDNKGLIERCIGQHDENMAAFRK
jgi:UDP-glucose 4-epimerase